MKPNATMAPPTGSTDLNVQAASSNADLRPQVNLFQSLFDRQKRLFATGVTRSYAWRIEQLDRMGRLLKENEAASQRLND